MVSKQAVPPPGTDRVGLYVHAGTNAQAKAAFLADFSDLPDSPDTYARWVAVAIAAHTARTSQDRADAVAALGLEDPQVRRSSIALWLPTQVVADADAALAADQGLPGRPLTRSGYVSDAMRVATAVSRERRGGVLPAVPRRLPPKLVRPVRPPSQGSGASS